MGAVIAVVSLALGLTLPRLPAEARLGERVPEAAAVQLGFSLRLTEVDALERLLGELQDATSPRFHQWLTPEAFGDRFGLSTIDYERAAASLARAGFAVQRWPSRLYLTATGDVAHARALLGVEPHFATLRGQRFRTFVGEARLPPELAPHVLAISGLDTRVPWRHRVKDAQAQTGFAFGAQDLRAFYDFQALIATGRAALGLRTAVLGTQQGDGVGNFVPPSMSNIQTYLQTVSKATAIYNPVVMANPGKDFDGNGANNEYELDVEMQSIGAANADQIDLVLAPASTVFSDGLNEIVNALSTVSVVSASLGICEPALTQIGWNTTSTEQLLKQGLAEGITWFAASGDEGADDCLNTGFVTPSTTATVDWPCALPEVVCLGGTQLAQPGNWDSTGALNAYQTEDAWNEGVQVGASGGGVSALFPKPTYQLGRTPEDGQRDVPDLALQSAVGTPGVAFYGERLGTTAFDAVGGTSVASPLAAGIFALVEGKLGCRLGDILPALYTLGAAQLDGGPALFHDILSGDNTLDAASGFSAGPGYDRVTGWGSLDVAALAAAWPACAPSSAPVGCGCASADGGADLLGLCLVLSLARRRAKGPTRLADIGRPFADLNRESC